MNDPDRYCDICEEHHESIRTVKSHQRAAIGYDEKYGVAV